MRFCFPQPLVAATSTVPWLCLWKTVSFFVCLNLSLHTITDCPLVLLFQDFLCSTSPCCLGLYRPLLYLPLTYLFSELENTRLCVFSCVSSLFLISQHHKETDVKKQLITTGEYQANRPCVLQSSSEIQLWIPVTKCLPHLPFIQVTPLTHKVSICFLCVEGSSPPLRQGWGLKDVIHYVGFGFTVLFF